VHDSCLIVCKLTKSMLYLVGSTHRPGKFPKRFIGPGLEIRGDEIPYRSFSEGMTIKRVGEEVIR